MLPFGSKRSACSLTLFYRVNASTDLALHLERLLPRFSERDLWIRAKTDVFALVTDQHPKYP
jgi:hypothetical protein